MRAARAIWKWLRSWFVRERPALPLRTVHSDELPEVLEAESVYVLGEGEYLWFVAMLCPCGCKSTLQMSLLPGAKPKWKLTKHIDGTISLHPSVWKTEGCRSHFFIRHNLIQWCPTYQSRPQQPQRLPNSPPVRRTE
jgi:hypothetical protein